MKVGELANATGLTVRTLHHYDAIGLLTPSGRSDAGYRLYAAADVERLFRIRALRRLGVPLGEIERALGGDLRGVVAAQLERVERDLAAQRRLRDRLERVLQRVDGGGGPSSEELLDLIEVMTMTDSYYTPEQRETLGRRREELGPDGMEQAQREWAELIAAAHQERERGTPPSDPRVQALARRWQELIDEFTGGDPGIRASLQRMYDEQGPERASRGMIDPELAAYMAHARETTG